MSKKTKAFLYNLAGFIVFYLPTMMLSSYLLKREDYVPSIVGFIVAIVLSPKFQYLKTNEGDKIFMKWLFVKGIKEIN